MRIKIENISFWDFILVKMSTDKISIGGTFLIIYTYIMLKTRYDLMMTGFEKTGLGLATATGGTIVIYALLYFFKYKKLNKENPIIKARFDKDSIKDFTIFGSVKEYKMVAYTQFNKIYGTKSTYFFKFDGVKYLFIPKKYLNNEEIEFINKKMIRK